jgi:Tfp pilus assembly protein PilX
MRRTTHGPARACAQVFRRLANARGDERGLALIAAIGIMTVLTVSGTALTYYATSGARASAHSRGGQTAYTLAEAGINNALSVLSNAGDPRVSTLLPSRTVTLEGGTATYSGTIDASYVWTITSTGTVRNPAGGTSIKRTLHRKVSVRGINSGADGNSWSRFYQDSTSSCLTIDDMTFVTNVATRGDLCLRNNGAITNANATVDVGGNVSIQGPDAASGPRSPTAATGTSWTSPTNAFSSNNTYATYSVASGGNSNYLDVTGFGFTIPATALIRGISVSIERKSSATNSLRDDDVYIKKSACTDPCGSDRADTSTYYGTSDSSDSHGSSSDLWGKTWTAADINSSSFGVHYRTHNFAGSAATASIDQITITVTYSADTNGIGTSGTPITQANIGGSCSYNAQSAHTPCSSTDHVYAGTITTTAAGSNPALSMPAVDYTYWWKNAKPGPNHFCTNANPGLATNFFDNDAASTSAPNGSILVNGEMAPANSNYDCQFVENGQLVGQLKWNHTTHRLDIKGVIFVDGNFRFDEDGQIIHYYGRANIMSSRDDEIDALVCAGGAVDGSGNPTGLTYATSCLSNMSSWDASANMMVLMSQMPNEYDQGSSTCGGSPPSCYNGHLPAGFQGIMYSTSDCMIHQNFQDSGPVICNSITLPNEGGSSFNPTFYAFPYLGNLTDGQKYSDASTATVFELDLGNSDG